MVPEKCCDIINEAIQMHGAAGISQWFPAGGDVAQAAHAASRRRSRSPPVLGRAEAKSRESGNPDRTASQ